MRNLLLCILVSLCLAGQIFAAEAGYYVQSVSAKIYAKPSLHAEVLGEVGRGQSLSATGKQGNWLKVRFGAADGFVSSFAVGTAPPQEKRAKLVGSDRLAQVGSWARARASSSQTIIAGIKGLAYEGRARSSKEELSNFTDLDLMDSLAIDPVELKNFTPGGVK